MPAAKVLMVVGLMWLLTACGGQTTGNGNNNGGNEDGIIHFSDIQGDVPTGCLEDYQPFADNGMFFVTGAPGGNGLGFFLTDTFVDSDTSTYSLAFFQGASKTPEAGDIYLIDAYVPGGTLLEYNCNLSDPQLVWVAATGTLEIESIDGNRATYKLIADMVPAPAPFVTPPVSFTLRFHGTTLFTSAPYQGE